MTAHTKTLLIGCYFILFAITFGQHSFQKMFEFKNVFFVGAVSSVFSLVTFPGGVVAAVAAATAEPSSFFLFLFFFSSSPSV